MQGSPANVNVLRWQTGDYVAEFANRTLRPVEVVILTRYRDALAGRVLEVGCGAGRILGYLLALGGEVHGIDVSPRMVDYCRRRYPNASVVLGDMTQPPAALDGRFDVIFASFNVADVLDDAARRALFADVHRRLAPGGLFIFSSHNLAFIEAGGSRANLRHKLAALNPRVRQLLVLPQRLISSLRNRRRLAPLQRYEADHAILNDQALDFALLHYYIRPGDQRRALDELGYDLVEGLDLEGNTIASGQTASHSPEIHYVARRR